MTPRERYINAITDQAVRKWVYAEARRILPTIGARCALTVWLFLREAELVTGNPLTYTVDVARIIEKMGGAVHPVRRITVASMLKRGDICFSKDKNYTPGPDHVYTMHTLGEPSLVVDNYAIGPHPRNITASGPKTPFDYALRLP